MDGSFYIIIVIAIMVKLMIWGCIIYSRNQRRVRMLQQLQAQQGQGIIIVGTTGGVMGPGHYPSQQVGGFIIQNENVGYDQGTDNPQVFTAPPTYDEVIQSKSAEVKPPSYDQVVQSQAQQPQQPDNSTS